MVVPIPVTVLGGYLGAGKTSLLNQVLRRADGRRIAVIVNDFGELGVDAALLADRAADGVIDLPNGCICCTLGNDLADVMRQLEERSPRPDQVVIEASGVADPAALAAWGTVPGFAPGGVVVLAAADAIRRLVGDRYVGGEVRRQLAAADIVVVSKLDLLDPAAGDSVVSWLEATVDAPVVAGGASSVEWVLAPTVSAPAGGQVPHAADDAPARDEVDHHDAARHARWSWDPSALDDDVSADELRRFLDRLPEWVFRVKGVVRTASAAGTGLMLVQGVGARRTLTPVAEGSLPSASGSGLVAIGPTDRFDSSALDELAERHLGPDRSSAR